ncbi:PqiC family protein [Rudaea sp.]|uniref:PqiC family protein n=1 Tax=Rudaea sp. TaxID=2136325 RepID=UPI002ED06970
MMPSLATGLRTLAACAALLLGACTSSVPTRYHSLLDASAEAIAAASPASFLIDVQPVGIPAQVDRPQLVVRDGGDVLPLEQERWIAPLADEVRAALSADLSRELATTDVAGQPRPPDARVLGIKVELRRFESVPGAYAAIDAVWSLSVNDAKSSPQVCASSAREPAGQGYDELVRAHRLTLAAIASRIASAARTYAAAGKGVCPAN